MELGKNTGNKIKLRVKIQIDSLLRREIDCTHEIYWGTRSWLINSVNFTIGRAVLWRKFNK